MRTRRSKASRTKSKVGTFSLPKCQAEADRTSGFSIDHKTLEQKYEEVVDLYREKSRKHAQAQKLYDTLKQKYQAGQMQSAASANVAQAIESIDAERRPETFNVLPDPRPRYPDTTAAPHVEGRLPRPSSLHGSIEQLHPHQRSGSSAVGSTGAGDHLRMPPPERQRASRMSRCLQVQEYAFDGITDPRGYSKSPIRRDASPPCSPTGDLTGDRKSVLSDSNSQVPEQCGAPSSRTPDFDDTESSPSTPETQRLYSQQPQ